MKRVLLLSMLFLALVSTSHAQNVMHYNFEGNLNEAGGTGPALKVLGTQGQFIESTLNEINNETKLVYRFDVGSGLQFDNTEADNFIGGTYTIEMYFLFDELGSWKRVVDYKNRKSDNGAYIFNGELNFYPSHYSEEAPIAEGEYTYYVITRNGETNELLIYTDASVMLTIDDSDGEALLDGDNVLNFFQDDLQVPEEETSGNIAMLKIYDYVLDSPTIASKFEDLSGQVLTVRESGNDDILIYPNPVNDFLNIRNGFGRVMIYNELGEKMIDTETADGRINVSRLTTGIYFIHYNGNYSKFIKR